MPVFFYKLMKPLLVFVNKKLELIPKISTVEDFDNIAFEDKPIIREGLYEEIHLIDGGSGQSELLSPTFSLVKASLELSDIVTGEKFEVEDIYICMEKIDRNFNNVQKELYYYDG